MSVLKKLAGETAIYGVSSIIGRFLNYLLVPFYTYVFHPEEYGIVTELYSYAAFLNVVLTYGMETTYFRFCNKEGADKEKVFYSIQTLVTLTTLAICGIALVFSGQIASLLKYPCKNELIIYLFLILAFDTLLAVPFARLRLEGKAKKFAIVKIFNILVNIGFNLLLLVILPRHFADFPLSVGMVFIANLVANALQVFFFTEYLRHWKPAQFYWSQIKGYVIYGIPLMVMGLAGMVNEVIDRVLLKFLLPEHFYPGITPLAAVGIYGACYKLSIFMSLGIQAFRYASEPFFFAKSQNKNSPQLYARVMHWFVLCCCTVLMAVSLNLNWIQQVLRGDLYRQGIGVVAPLLLANLFLGIYYNLSIWYKLTDKTHYGMWISIGGAILTLILNIVWIPKFGYMGCAMATLACYFGMAAISYWLGNTYFPVPYKVPYVLFAIGTCALLVWYWLVTARLASSTEHLTNNLSWLFLLVGLFLIGRKTKAL